MEGIEHKRVSVNGINMHLAYKGEQGPIILFLHGFPELWYTWRHQITAFAALGYRAVAPDLRGFGDTDAPADVATYSCLHVVADLVALIHSLGGGQPVFLVAHDWGAMIGWYLCLFRPDLVNAFVSLTVPFRPRHPKLKPVESMRAFFGEDYYMCRFQEEGTIESEIAEYGVEAVIKKILTGRSPGLPRWPKGNPLGPGFDSNSIKLPHWFTEQDLKYYVQKYNQSGFTGGLNYYRALDLNWELTAAWTGAKVTVPVKFMVGDIDMVYNTPGVKEYVHGGDFKKDVPLLEECVVMENTGHFINQERPHEVILTSVPMVAADFIVGIIGNIVSIISFASSIGTFKKIVKKKSSENYKGVPYVTTLLSTSLWIMYGSLDPDDGILIVTVNAVGVTSQIAYLVLFLFYASKERKVKYFGFILLDLVFLGIVVAITLAAFHGDSRRTFTGVLCATFTIAMYAAPLTAVARVIRTKSIKYMPFFLSFSLVVNAAVWFTFAMLLKDYYVLVPNAVGIVLGSLQLIVYFVYMIKSSTPEFNDTMAVEEKQDLEKGKFGSSENGKLGESMQLTT